MLTLQLKRPCAASFPPQIHIFQVEDDQSAPSISIPATETSKIISKHPKNSKEKLIRPKRSATVSEKCRLCGAVSPEMSPIFGAANIAEKIATILPLRVDPEDRLPLNVCRRCCGRLEDAHDFYLTCIDADSSLQKQLAAEDAENALRRQYIPLILTDHSYTEQGGAAVVTDEKLVSVSKLLPESHRVAQAIEAVHAGRGKDVPLLSKTRSVEEAMDLLSTPQTPNLHLFHCSKCNSNLSNSFELLEHDLQKFSCKRCPRKFCTAKLQRKHRVEHQEKIIINPSENMDKHSCHLCEARFNSSMQLALHLDLHRGARYECDACKRNFQHKIHLARHIKLKHHALYHFRCNFCQLQFNSRMEVVQHVQEHDDSDLLRSDAPNFELVTPYKCEVCGECKSSPVVLRKHAEKHGSQDDANDLLSKKCHLCDKQFKTEKNLRTHVTMGHLRGAHIFVRTRVSSPKKHACSQCPRRFRRLRELADHLSFFHSNILQYSCNFCQKKFGTNAGRKVHIYGKRPMSEYPCGACEAKFESKCERDLHQTQQHEQRFPCTICGASFGRKSQLHGHIGRKHAHQTAKSIYCDVCGKGFNIATKFKKHCLSHSPGQ